jgi:hypothetical protein
MTQSPAKTTELKTHLLPTARRMNLEIEVNQVNCLLNKTIKIPQCYKTISTVSAIQDTIQLHQAREETYSKEKAINENLSPSDPDVDMDFFKVV